MKKYFTKYNTKLLALATTIISFGFVMPIPAYAQSVIGSAVSYLGFIGIGAILSVLDAIGLFIQYVSGLFVFIGGTLVNWTLDLNAQLLNSSTVQIGWVVSRDIANLGFVLLLIIIAFATILRFESYQMKKTLWKLIVAALLINFSMVGAGLFIDFSGVLTNFFLNKATDSNQSQLGPGIANIFQTSKILMQPEDQSKIESLVQGASTDPNKHIPFTASVYFAAGFTIIVAISLISLSAMLFMRYIWLTMLLILMPLAWMFWAWPDLSDKWSKWWSEFIRWTFFAPSVSFFLYLALSIVKHPVAPVSEVNAIGLTIPNFGALLGQMISVLGILYGGMYTANKMGIEGASVGSTVYNKMKGYMTGATGATGAYIGRKYGMGGLDRLSTSFGSKQTVNERLRGVTAGMTGIPLIGDTFQNLNSQLKKSGEATIGEWIKHYDGMDAEGRKNAFSGRILSPEERSGAMASMAKNGQMRDMQKMPDFEKFAQMAIKRGGETSKIMISKDPELAKFKVNPEDPEFKGQPTSKIIQARRAEVANAYANIAPDGIKDVSAELLTANVDNLAKIRPSFLSAFGEHKDYKDKDILTKKLMEQIKNLTANIKILSGEEKTASEGLLNNLSSKMKFMAKSPAWAGLIDADMRKLIGIEKKKGGKKEDEDEE